jgi:hypothetical protein
VALASTGSVATTKNRGNSGASKRPSSLSFHSLHNVSQAFLDVPLFHFLFSLPFTIEFASPTESVDIAFHINAETLVRIGLFVIVPKSTRGNLD